MPPCGGKPALRNEKNRDAGRKPTYDTGVSEPERVASPATTKEKRQQGCPSRLRANRSPKRKSPDWHRGALPYADKSTRLVIALSSKKWITCKRLKGRTLACDKRRRCCC